MRDGRAPGPRSRASRPTWSCARPRRGRGRPWRCCCRISAAGRRSCTRTALYLAEPAALLDAAAPGRGRDRERAAGRPQSGPARARAAVWRAAGGRSSRSGSGQACRPAALAGFELDGPLVRARRGAARLAHFVTPKELAATAMSSASPQPLSTARQRHGDAAVLRRARPGRAPRRRAAAAAKERSSRGQRDRRPPPRRREAGGRRKA